MKKLLRICSKLLLGLGVLAVSYTCSAQDSAAASTSVNLRYFILNNNIHYLVAETRIKEGKKFKPVPRQKLEVYLDTTGEENLVMKAITDENGKAKMIIPPALQRRWLSSPKHTFISVLNAEPAEDGVTIEVTRAKVMIDTATVDGIRSVTASVKYLEGEEWLPAADVEMKVGVARSGGILSSGDELTYTTDSTGTVVVEFNKDSLPGDQQGNLKLVAKVEDNDQYGNLLVEKTVPWGLAFKPDRSFFNQRALWSTKTPLWLLFMACSIVIGVWATIIYLLWQIYKIKRLGDEAKRHKAELVL